MGTMLRGENVTVAQDAVLVFLCSPKFAKTVASNNMTTFSLLYTAPGIISYQYQFCQVL